MSIHYVSSSQLKSKFNQFGMSPGRFQDFQRIQLFGHLAPGSCHLAPGPWLLKELPPAGVGYLIIYHRIRTAQNYNSQLIGLEN